MDNKPPKSRADIRKQAYRPNRSLKPLSRFSHSQSAESKAFRQSAINADLVTDDGLSATRLAMAREAIAIANGEAPERKRRKRTTKPQLSPSVFRGLKLSDIEI